MIENSLLFELAILARQFTSSGAFLLAAGCRMPKVGKPLWPLAAAFLNDLLGEHLTEHDAQDRIQKLQQRNPELSWVGWPEPPEQYSDTPPPDTWY